jgi:hypothetical protein
MGDIRTGAHTQAMIIGSWMRNCRNIDSNWRQIAFDPPRVWGLEHKVRKFSARLPNQQGIIRV